MDDLQQFLLNSIALRQEWPSGLQRMHLKTTFFINSIYIRRGGHQMGIFNLMLNLFINFLLSVSIPSNSLRRNFVKFLLNLLKSSLFDYT